MRDLIERIEESVVSSEDDFYKKYPYYDILKRAYEISSKGDPIKVSFKKKNSKEDMSMSAIFKILQYGYIINLPDEVPSNEQSKWNYYYITDLGKMRYISQTKELSKIKKIDK